MTDRPTSAQDVPVVLQNEKRGLLTVEEGRFDVLELSKDGRRECFNGGGVEPAPKRLHSGPVRNLLRIKLSPPLEQQSNRRRLDIHTLIQRGTQLRLSKMHVLVEPVDSAHAERWAEYAMLAAYVGVKPFRRVLLLVNPIGGKGKAKSIVRETVMPILEAAGCVVDVRETTHQGHAEEIVRDIPLDYDVIATSSGDGTIYEVMNGLGNRPDGMKAFQIPVAPIPTGSANGLAINLFGVKDTFNVPLACLNAIKGKPLPLDLCSVLLLPSNQRRFSFLSTALGLMVDLDIGTENIRWLGDSRFVLGFVKGVMTNKNFKCRLRIKVEEDDKISMARKARERVQHQSGKDRQPGVTSGETRSAKTPASEGASAEGSNSASGSLAHPRTNGKSNGGDGDMSFGGRPNGGSEANGAEGKNEYTREGPIPDTKPLEPDDTWLTIDSSARSANGVPKNRMQASIGEEGILYFYAGTMPWVSRDLMQFPVATSGQGVIDVVVQTVVPRATLISAITGAEKGEAYWMECQHYYKASAIVGENIDPEKQKMFTIDGEAFEFSSFHLEVLPRLAHTLSLEGHFFISDFLEKNHKKD